MTVAEETIKFVQAAQKLGVTKPEAEKLLSVLALAKEHITSGMIDGEQLSAVAAFLRTID